MSFSKSVIISYLFLVSSVYHAFALDPYSKRMADAQMARSGAITSWDYPNGLFVESVLKVYNQYGGSAYYNYALNHAKATVSATSGKIATG
ncbi:MAG TPA: glycoside hydrolase family 88 protein, partial [Paludibacter sp.]